MDKISPWAFVGMREPPKSKKSTISVKKQLDALEVVIMTRYNMVIEDITNHTRNIEHIYVRHLVTYWMRKELELSLLTIGKLLRRDHTSIMYCVKQFQNRIDTKEQTPNGLRVRNTLVSKDYKTFIKEIMHRCL